ncbi:MAG: hypothetical protein WBV82_32465 [Myxococcaceae bacterium]
MRPDEVLCDDPTPEELARRANQLPSPEPAAVEALRQALEAAPDPSARKEWPQFLEFPRTLTDSRHADPPSSHRPVLGLVLVPMKRAFRATFQPFINEVLRRQVQFNEAILGAAVALNDRLEQHLENQSLWRASVDARLARIEELLKSGRERD